MVGKAFLQINRKGNKMDTSANETKQENGLTSSLQENQPTQSRAFQPDLIDRLFMRFSAMYGNKFLDMWKDIEIADVKKCWSDELRIFSVEQVGIAVGNLKNNNFPPTLPEFLQLCESARKDKPRNTFIALPKRTEDAAQSQEWHDAKARCLGTVARLGGTFGAPSNAWANKLLTRHGNGENIPPDSLRMAREAIQ